MDFDKIVFKKKKFSDILEEIYNNSKSKEKQISTLIVELQPLIKNIGDATVIVPLIAEYLDMGIKNDEHLIKVAGIIQRALGNGSGGENGEILSEEEKAQLLADVNSIKDEQIPLKPNA